MPAAVAFLPHPPVLVPALAQGAARELDELRAACRAAIEAATAGAGRIVLVGAGPRSQTHERGTRGTLAGFGEPVEAGLGKVGPGESRVALPLSLTIGAWLLGDTDADVTAVEVGPEPAPAIPDADTLLVLGDASARRSIAAPGYLDDRAEGYDRAVEDALRSGDPARLAALDVHLGTQLLAAGAPVWAAAATALRGRTYAAELSYADAPYGVGYLVATWRAA